MGVCVHVRVFVTFAARMVLMHINVMIFSEVRSRPLVQVSFHVHYYASYFDSSYFEIYHKASLTNSSINRLSKTFRL